MAKCRNTGRTHFKKGAIPWNKGIKTNKKAPNNNSVRKECEICFKRFMVPLSRSKSSKYCSRKCFNISKKNNTGEKNNNWVGGSWLYVRRLILIEQDYTCQVCGLREPDIMEVNHKLERSSHPELSRDKDNLEVLCPNCHRRKTNIFLKSKKNKNRTI